MQQDSHTTLTKTYAAFLFDMDGTLLSSIEAAERVWGAWAARHGLDVAAFLPTIHGVRAVETIARQQLSGIDVEAEAAWITKREIEDLDGVIQIAGIVTFLNALPADKWAIVTSATPDLAGRRLAAVGIVPPAVMITADDVANGKPSPDCFLLAAERLGVAPQDCLVFEDAPAGIAAAEAAGADVVVITATHKHPFSTPHLTIPHYLNLVPTRDGQLGLTVVLDPA